MRSKSVFNIGSLVVLLNITIIASLRHTILASDNLESSTLFHGPHLTLIVISDQAVNRCEDFWKWEQVRFKDGTEKPETNDECKMWKYKKTQSNKYSKHGYDHRIENIQQNYFNIKLWDHWLQIYEILVMYDGILEFYEIESPKAKYQKKFYLKSWGLQSHGNFIFSQLNKDNFILINFCEPHTLLEFFGGTIPRGLQKYFERQPKQSLCHYKTDISFKYYCDSCLNGAACVVKPRKSYFKDFTKVFRSNDRLFCDVFWYYNVSGSGKWIRNTKKVADDNRHFINEAPQWTIAPHASNSICYEVSGVSFIILQEPPSFSDNLIRPFQVSVWTAMVVALVSTWLIVLGSILILKTDPISRQKILNGLQLKISNDMKAYGIRFLKKLVWLSMDFLKVVYSAILLFTLLSPSFSLTPQTYSSLNETRSINLSSTKNSNIDIEQVRQALQLRNQIDSKNKTHFYIQKLFEVDERSKEYRIAVLLYSMDVEYYISSRIHVHKSAKYAHRIVRSKEKARNQQIFISASPASPHLHFLINGLQRVVEGGLYDKWLQMEKHFYSFVSPVLASNHLELNEITTKRYDLNVVRTLGMEEFSPTLVLIVVLLSGTLVFATFEMLSDQHIPSFLILWMRLKWYKIAWIFQKLSFRICSLVPRIVNFKIN